MYAMFELDALIGVDQAQAQHATATERPGPWDEDHAACLRRRTEISCVPPNGREVMMPCKTQAEVS